MTLHLHKHMSNQELGEVFAFIAGVLALQGADRFRIRAYDNAAAAIAQFPKELHEMFLTDPDFNDVPAIGETLNQKLTELFTTGTIKAFQEYVKDIPAGTYPLVKVQGIGVKKAYKLATTFKLEDETTALIETLKVAQQGKIRSLDGFGEKSEKVIIEALQSYVERPRMPYSQAQAQANKVIAELKACPAISQIEALGSLRREAPTIGDIDLGIAITDIGRVKEFVKNMKIVKKVLASGDNLLRVIIEGDHQVDIKIATEAEWGAFLQHFTGSKEHNIKLREFALKQGKSLSEHGIKIQADGQEKLIPFADETAFYQDLGLRWIPPQERLGQDEIEHAKLAQK
jgi:DNA polymerase (family 10)